jgi:hypothetical protein
MRDNLVLTQREVRRVGRLFRALPASPWTAALLAAGFVLLLPHLAPAFGVPVALRSALTDLRNLDACPAPGSQYMAGSAPQAPSAVSHSDAREGARCAMRSGPGRMG